MSKLKYAAVHKGWATMHSVLEIMGGVLFLSMWTLDTYTGYDRHRVEMSPEACYPSAHKCPAHEELLQPCDLHFCKTSDMGNHALTFYALFPNKYVYITCPAHDFGRYFHSLFINTSNFPYWQFVAVSGMFSRHM